MKSLLRPATSFFIISVLCFSCSVEQSKQEQPVTESTIESVEIKAEGITEAEVVELEKKASCTEEPCTTVSIKFPRFESYPEFNKNIEGAIQSALGDFVMDAKGGESIEELEQLFIASYEEFLKEFPESSTPWSIEINMERVYSKNEFVSLMMSTYSYTGGAHPNGFVNYINLSENKKKTLKPKDFISNINKLEKLAETQFRKHYGIADQESFADYGFTFDNDKFSLPENIGLSNEGLVIYYNSYDIAAYAAGPTELIIPFEQVEELLKI